MVPIEHEKNVRTYLHHHVNYYSTTPNVSAFYRWQDSMIQPVKIESVSSIPGLMQVIDAAMKDCPRSFQLKHCYDNAFNLSTSSYANQQIHYVEGFSTCGEYLCGHAWNSWNGRHFDVTGELASDETKKLGGSIASISYLRVIELDPLTAFARSLDSDSGPLQIPHFLKTHKLKKSALDRVGLLVPDMELLSDEA